MLTSIWVETKQLAIDMKICRDCKIEKPLCEFVKNKLCSGGIDSLCLICNRKRIKIWRKKNPELRKQQALKESSKDKVYNQRKHLKATYNMSVEEYNKMFLEQNGCCAICKLHQSEFKRRLCVDHCHTTGKIRQLLCLSCNQGLGNFKDNILFLQEAIKYLQTGY